jgi:hypothetical protein
MAAAANLSLAKGAEAAGTNKSGLATYCEQSANCLQLLGGLQQLATVCELFVTAVTVGSSRKPGSGT